MDNCFICGLYGLKKEYIINDCDRCGHYIGEEYLKDLSPNKKARLSQIVRKRWDDIYKNKDKNRAEFNAKPFIDIKDYELENLAEITSAEIMDNILVCFAKKIPKAWGDFIFIEIRDGTPDNYRKNKENINASDYAHIGLLPNPNKFALQSQILYFCEHLEKQEFLKKTLLFSVNDMKYSYYIQIKPEGWARYDEIQKQTNTSKKAFLAKKFLNEEDLKKEENITINIFWDKLAKIIKEQLSIILENPLETTPKAGLIDTRMEKEIEEARFIIADLSHGNQGAYWEAGLAFGLGKKVIYTKYDDGVEPHFDTRHRTTIFWKKGEEEVAIKKIITTIKNSGIL
jgi:nucleoside 2-deoxyribosyltransferase